MVVYTSLIIQSFQNRNCTLLQLDISVSFHLCDVFVFSIIGMWPHSSCCNHPTWRKIRYSKHSVKCLYLRLYSRDCSISSIFYNYIIHMLRNACVSGDFYIHTHTHACTRVYSDGARQWVISTTVAAKSINAWHPAMLLVGHRSYTHPRVV